MPETSPPVEPSIRVEFAVKLEGEDDLTKIDKLLANIKGVSLIRADAVNKTIQLELGGQVRNESGEQAPAESRQFHRAASHNVHALQRLIEKETGIVTVVKGLGSLGSAVAELRPPPHSEAPLNQKTNHPQGVMGVVRLSQLSDGKCFLDALLDGFNGTRADCYQCNLAIHEYGDLNSSDFESIGQPIIQLDSKPPSTDGGSSFSVQKIIANCDVAKMIGKSIAATTQINDDTRSRRVISAGVIARAATVEANKKQICTCSGKTIWQERLDRQQAQSCD